jgi:hypothetical protein
MFTEKHTRQLMFITFLIGNATMFAALVAIQVFAK